MERRVTSHTEEEEMNQRRKLLTLAKKGDQKAISKLFELYQVKLYTGELLKKVRPQPIKPPTPTVTGGVKEGKASIKGKKTAEKTPPKGAKTVSTKGKKKTVAKPASRPVKKAKPDKKAKKTVKPKAAVKAKVKTKVKPKIKPKPKVKSKLKIKSKAKPKTVVRQKRKPKAKKK